MEGWRLLTLPWPKGHPAWSPLVSGGLSVVRASSRYAITHLTASGVKYSNQYYCLCTDTMPLKLILKTLSYLHL